MGDRKAVFGYGPIIGSEPEKHINCEGKRRVRSNLQKNGCFIGKTLMEKYRYPSNLQFSTLSIGSWFHDRWIDFRVGTEKFRTLVDESYCRVMRNKERLEQICAKKRAQELYYGHLVHSREEMDSLARSIQKQDL